MLGFGNKRQRPAAGGYREQGNGYTPPQSQTAGYQGGYQNTQMGQPQTAEYPGGYQNAQQMGQFAGYGEDQQDLQDYINKRTSEIDAQVKEFSEKNPNFDMRREMQNPKFCNYVWGKGLSIEDAYYLCHREEQNYGDSQYRSRGEKPSAERRITENGTGKAGSGAMVKKNPEELTDDELDEIVKRVRNGEKITL